MGKITVTPPGPPPDIFWYLNGQRLIQDERHRIIVNEAGCHALLITSSKLEDGGIISCLAKNGSGEAAFQVNLDNTTVYFTLGCVFLALFRPANGMPSTCMLVKLQKTLNIWQVLSYVVMHRNIKDLL